MRFTSMNAQLKNIGSENPTGSRGKEGRKRSSQVNEQPVEGTVEATGSRRQESRRSSFGTSSPTRRTTRKAGDMTLFWNGRLRRDNSKVGDQPVSRFGSVGAGDGQFSNPWSVACNVRGEIVVADYSNHRIQVFGRNGKFWVKWK